MGIKMTHDTKDKKNKNTHPPDTYNDTTKGSPGVAARLLNIIALLALVGIVGTLLEYFGVINLVPTFGREGRSDLEEIELFESPQTFNDLSAAPWAEPFITGLAEENIISGFPNGEFRPNDFVTRAEFAAMIQSAFGEDSLVETDTGEAYGDVPEDFWARDAIAQVTEDGFLTGYPDGEFRPDQNMTRVNALVAIANGLDLPNTLPPEEVLQVYEDADRIPDYAREAIAAATEAGIVVSYPQVNQLNPDLTATRADIAAFIYQAMVETGQMDEVASEFVVTPQS
jgi:hypothetical protein